MFYDRRKEEDGEELISGFGVSAKFSGGKEIWVFRSAEGYNAFDAHKAPFASISGYLSCWIVFSSFETA